MEDDLLPTERNMKLANPCYANPHNIYYSSVSRHGTVLPRLIRRQPIACQTRQQIKLYAPQFAEIKLINHKQLIGAVSAHQARLDMQQFTEHFGKTTAEYKQPVTFNAQLPRFPSIKEHFSNIDVTSYGSDITTMEDILINEPLVAPFFGIQDCPYCTESLIIQSASTFMTHLHTVHPYMIHGHFTCPACLISEAYTAHTYLHHYCIVHSRTEALTMVLNETAVHARAQQGLILFMYLSCVKLFKIPIAQMDPLTVVTHLGAITTSDPAPMMLDYIDTQQNHVPDDLYIPSPPTQNKRHHKDNSTQPQKPAPVQLQPTSQLVVATQAELYNKLATLLGQLAIPPTQNQQPPAEEPQPQRQPRPQRAKESEIKDDRAETPQMPMSFSTSRYTGQRGSQEQDFS
jgi:hypothetical protein